MMNILAGMGLAGSAVLLLWLPVSKALKNRLPARWHYRILKTGLFFFLVPVGRLVPLAARALSALSAAPAAAPYVSGIPAAAIPHIAAPAQTPMPLPAPAALPEAEVFALSDQGLRVLAAVWAAGAAAVLLHKAHTYFRLRRHVFRKNRPVSSGEAQVVFWACKRELNLRGMVALRENPSVRSPFAAGLARPTVVIPAVPLAPEELRYLFLHELTHIKCGDLWVRFASMAALAIHWYNPLAHLLSRSIRTVSEQSCDERIACPLTKKERYAYGSVIMKLASNVAAESGDWAASLSARESIERRLIRVLRTEKLKGGKRLAALALAVSILACGTAAALTAREPLPVARAAAGPARTVPTLPAEDGPKGGGSAAKPGESTAKPNGDAAKPGGALPAAVTAPKEDETDKPKEADRPVTTNGTPSESFLKELRAYYAAHVPGITEDTPVLFGDHDLIVKRGGTLLPDEEFSSYTCSYGGSENKAPVIYKQFMTRPSPASTFVAKSGATSYGCEEYFVGNLEALDGLNLDYLNDLVDGEYPKNSRGESYGHAGYSDYVGYQPDLVSALGTKGEFGYLYAPDEGKLPHNLPKNECPHEFLVPLYDREHNEIGKFEMCCGGHMMEDVITPGLSLEEAKAAIASGEISYPEPTYDNPGEETLAKIREAWEVPADTPVLFGDRELILSRGGVLLPDDAPSSYMMSGNTLYKQFKGKDGCGYVEYNVGNVEVLSEFARKLAGQQLVNGDYPRNSKGETYGAAGLFTNFVGYAPDLIAAVGEDNVEGYIRERDQLGYALRKAGDIEGYMALQKANPGPQPIPLYDSEGKVIGAFMHGGGYGLDELGLQGMSIEEAKAALAKAPQ